jgi:hypothetical protein
LYPGDYRVQGYTGFPQGQLFSGYPQAAPQPPAPAAQVTQAKDSGDLDLPTFYPAIYDWLAHCMTVATRSNKGIDFLSLSNLFTKEGFYTLEQLDANFITAKQLQEWLGVSLGTGVLLLQYAKWDLDAIKNGTFQFDSIQGSSNGNMGTSNMDYTSEMTFNDLGII